MKYKIPIDQTKPPEQRRMEMNVILKRLFSLGYIYGKYARYKTFDEYLMYDYTRNDTTKDSFILIGDDSECKKVIRLSVLSGEWLYNLKTVSFEEFLLIEHPESGA